MHKLSKEKAAFKAKKLRYKSHHEINPGAWMNSDERYISGRKVRNHPTLEQLDNYRSF